MKRCKKCGISFYEACLDALLHDAICAAGGSISGVYCEHEFIEIKEDGEND